jgi:hypothetical protein
MSSHPEGLAIARARIAEEKEKRTGFLDLGRLGLTELPGELFELDDLRGLNLGIRWQDREGKWQEASSRLAWSAPQKPVHLKWESLARLCPGGAHDEATDCRPGGAIAP